MRYDFERITAPATVTRKCACGKWSGRSKTFWQTVNPFNRNDDGTVKTRAEVAADVHREAAEWRPVYNCPGCGAPVLPPEDDQ